MIRHLLLLFFLAAGPARADELADLRAGLGRLHRGDPVKASLEYSFWSRQGDASKGKVTQGKASLRFEDDPQGMKVFCSRATLDQTNQESLAAAKDPELGNPTAQALRNLGPGVLSECLDPGDWLLRVLEGAVLVEARQEPFNGVQARCLVLKLNPKLSALSRKYVKDLQANCKVWLGPDGMPLGITEDVKAKGRVFLIISFVHTESVERRFAKLGNRLVTAYRRSEIADSGGGESGSFRETFILNYE
jgi:hypothetical protein